MAEREAGSEIIATFALDSDGILQVSATEKATGLAKSITIQNVLTDAARDSLSQARDKISRLFGEQETAESKNDSGDSQPKTVSNSRKVQAQALVDKARNLLQTACEEDREDLIDLIEAIDSALAEDDATLLQNSTDELAELIFFLET